MEVTRASKTGTSIVGHAGHPDESTMGQFGNEDGGIYLVESETDVATLEVKGPTKRHCSQLALLMIPLMLLT